MDSKALQRPTRAYLSNRKTSNQGKELRAMITITRESTKAPRYPTEPQEGGSLRRVIPTAPASPQGEPGKKRPLLASYLKKEGNPPNYAPNISAGILAPPGGLKRANRGPWGTRTTQGREGPQAPAPGHQPAQPGPADGVPYPLLSENLRVCVSIFKNQKNQNRDRGGFYI